MKKNNTKFCNYYRAIIIIFVLVLFSCFNYKNVFGYGGGVVGNITPSMVSAVNVPLSINHNQSGTLIQKLIDDTEIEVNIPKGAVNGQTTMLAETKTLSPEKIPLEGAIILNNRVYNINAYDIENNEVKNFSEKITISLRVSNLPDDIGDLGVYYFADNTQRWILVPDSNFYPDENSIVFTVSHLTDFAILKIIGTPEAIDSKLKQTKTSNHSTSGSGSVNSVSVKSIQVKNEQLLPKVTGHIILKVEDKGEAYYVNPKTKTAYFLGRPKDAFDVMKSNGIGITNDNLNKIPIGITEYSGQDSDGDGLSDLLEDAIGTNKNNIDTDGDGFNDKEELQSGHNPSSLSDIETDNNLINRLRGQIVLQIESHGEAWYINPNDGKRYYLGRPTDAFNIMRKLGLGISNDNFSLLVK